MNRLKVTFLYTCYTLLPVTMGNAIGGRPGMVRRLARLDAPALSRSQGVAWPLRFTSCSGQQQRYQQLTPAGEL